MNRYHEWIPSRLSYVCHMYLWSQVSPLSFRTHNGMKHRDTWTVRLSDVCRRCHSGSRTSQRGGGVLKRDCEACVGLASRRAALRLHFTRCNNTVWLQQSTAAHVVFESSLRLRAASNWHITDHHVGVQYVDWSLIGTICTFVCLMLLSGVCTNH